jgi:epoxyqueuosine reductase
MESTTKDLICHLQERGYQGRIVPIQHLCDLQEEIEQHHKQGHFAEEFYQERLAWFDFTPPDSLPRAASLIIVAVPRPQSRVVFSWNGESRSLILPPTYVGYDEIRQHIEDLLASVLAPAGFHVARTALPLKLLAVRSGLAEYGRNNISYVTGMASFHQLVAVYSDLPCQEDTWREAQMMASCQNCRACLNHCPTGAIPSDRFLLHAERCIVFHNERPGNLPFPTWMDPSWHNCPVGCMHCQVVCPENKKVLGWVEQGAEFSSEETRLLMEGISLDRLPAETVRKLKESDLADMVDSLPRNLRVLLERVK